MWDKPQLMTAVSDLLLVSAAAVLFGALVVWAAHLPVFPLREVIVMQELREVRRSEVEQSLSDRLRGNFFSINLDGVRRSLEQLPWIRHVDIRRRWPSSLEVSIEEHVPAAFWGQSTGQLVNSYGEVFAAEMNASPTAPIPLLVGPSGWAPEMLTYYREAAEMLKPLGRVPQELNVSPRLAMQLRLDDGMIVELGRQQTKAPVKERLERFVEHYKSIMTAALQRPKVVDMRYPNGFALRVAAAPAIENKGKP